MNLLPATIAVLLAAGPGGETGRSRTVAGWLVEDRAEQDGGRLVRMRRDADGFRLHYQVSFWRGNDGRIQATLVEHSDCTNGDELDRGRVPRIGEIRARLTANLADCGASPGRIAIALRGIEAAYRLASAWAGEAAAATAAEAAAIANYGTAPEPWPPEPQ